MLIIIDWKKFDHFFILGSISCLTPSTITIKVGDTVTWKNDDAAPHYITSGSTANGQDGKFTSSLMKSGDEFTHTFLDYGEFTYFDMINPWIQGTVIVEEWN